MYRTATALDVVDASRQRSFLIIADKGAGLPTMYARDTLLLKKKKKEQEVMGNFQATTRKLQKRTGGERGRGSKLGTGARCHEGGR